MSASWRPSSPDHAFSPMRPRGRCSIRDAGAPNAVSSGAMPLMTVLGAVRPRPRSLTSMPTGARWRISPRRSKASPAFFKSMGTGATRGWPAVIPRSNSHSVWPMPVASLSPSTRPPTLHSRATSSPASARFMRLRRGSEGAAAEERRAVRQAETKPIMEALKTRLMTALAELPSRSSLVEAIKYMLGHWAGLTVFLEDGRIEVDTNTVERTMRPIALGRKNALFAGSQSGARTWAILASLINTAKLNDLDPHTYLADVGGFKW